MIVAAQLRALPAFAEFGDEELDMLLAAAQPKYMRREMWLCREGAPGASCFVLVTGQLEVVKATANGEVPIATMRPGSIVGQMALVDRGTRSASIRALEDCVVLELTREVFEKLLAACSPLGLRFQEQTALAGIRQLRAAIARLATVSPAQTAPPAEKAHAQRPQTDDDIALAYIQTAVNEWGLSLEEAGSVRVVHHDGIASSAERKSRHSRLTK